MTDYQRLIDFFMDEIPEDSPFEGKIRYMVEKLIAEGVTFQKWIPVSERLPNIFGEFNVVVKRNTGEIYSDYADFDPFTKRWTTGLFFDIGSKVTHWMPLPAPPEGE